MNDQQFLERAHANPHDNSPDFLEAAAGNPQRLQLVDDLKVFDDKLKAGLGSVSPPAGLRQALLDIPEGRLHPDSNIAAANDSFWRRNARYAAVIVIAIGVIAVFVQSQSDPMEDMVFTHIYSELPFLDEETPVTIEEINAVMVAWVGSDFASSSAMDDVEFNFSKECWVDFANGVKGMHMVVQGNVGPVTVMIIPNTPLTKDMAISDARFEGVISPTAAGNLVVVGEKDESIQQFSTLLAGNINW